MATKKRITFIICGVVLVLVLAVAGILIWFFSPGIHHLFHFTHVDYTAGGYIVSEEGEVLGEATLSMSGIARAASENGIPAKKNRFCVELTGYEPVTKDDPLGPCTLSRNGGITELQVVKTQLRSILSTNASELDTFETDHYNYYFMLDEKESELLMCLFISDVDDMQERVYFIPTDDPDNAYEEIKAILNRAYK